MDFGTLIGIIGGTILVVTAMFLGGDLSSFVNIPGIMIVFGGTVAATLTTFQVKEVTAAFKAGAFVFSEEKTAA